MQEEGAHEQMTTSRYIVLAKDEGLILTSGPEEGSHLQAYG